MSTGPLKSIPPSAAARLAGEGALLVDVREPDEYARASIAGSENHPLSRIGPLGCPGPVVFLCRSGMRTGANATRLAACHTGDAFVLEGGLDGWRAAGLPVVENTRAPLEIMRQVQIIAGSLILLGVALGFLVGPAWFGLAAFVGAGLTFAGITGWCGMALALSRAPWNRPSAG